MLKCCGLNIFFIWSIRNWDLNNCENILIIINVVTFSQNVYFQLWLVIVLYFIILFRLVRNWYVNNCENMWNLFCQYNNINFNLHQYLKEKKNFRHCSYNASWINKRIEQRKKKKKAHETKALLQLHCCTVSTLWMYSTEVL